MHRLSTQLAPNDPTCQSSNRCIVQLHCLTGCDGNSDFYGKRKKSMFDQMTRRQLSRCGESLYLEEEVVGQSNDMSSTATTRIAPWLRLVPQSGRE